MNTAILEKADCLGGAVFSDQVMGIFEANDPLGFLEIVQPFYYTIGLNAGRKPSKLANYFFATLKNRTRKSAFQPSELAIRFITPQLCLPLLGTVIARIHCCIELLYYKFLG